MVSILGTFFEIVNCLVMTKLLKLVCKLSHFEALLWCMYWLVDCYSCVKFFVYFYLLKESVVFKNIFKLEWFPEILWDPSNTWIFHWRIQRVGRLPYAQSFFSISWRFSGKFGVPTETKTEYTQNFSKRGINKSSFSVDGLFF